MDISFEVTGAPAAADVERLGSALAAFNASDVGPSAKEPLAVFVRDGAGDMIAGLSGSTGWGWLFVQWLWVGERARRQGLAAALLARAESEALARGCHGAWIDTFNPAALRVYEKAGYVPFGALPDFPAGRSRTFLQKRLAQEMATDL